MAVTGWELFRERFSGFEDSYNLIGKNVGYILEPSEIITVAQAAINDR
jgi:hypothetical protein